MVMLSIVVMSVIILRVIILSVIVLSVIMLSVVMFLLFCYSQTFFRTSYDYYYGRLPNHKSDYGQAQFSSLMYCFLKNDRKIIVRIFANFTSELESFQ